MGMSSRPLVLVFTVTAASLAAACGGGGPDPIPTAPDAGTPPPVPDGAQPPTGSVALVSPLLAYDFSTDVYTLSFWIKNDTASQMRAITRVQVSAGAAFPEITAVDCPEDTPGYQWNVGPGQLSSQLGIAFGSSTTIPKTAIDMTCGSRVVLKSVPFGFHDVPPFDLLIEGLLANGSTYTLAATVQ